MSRNDHTPDRWTITPSQCAAMAEIAGQLRRESTPTEALLWAELRGRRLDGWKFRRQQPIGPFVVDFYCAAARLIVEVDGSVHDDEEQQRLDLERQELLESLGMRMLRCSARDVEQRVEEVLEAIRSALTPQPPLPPNRGEGELPRR